MKKFNECLKIVDKISEEGGYDTLRVYLASMMMSNPEVYDNILECKLHGKTVKEVIGGL